MRRSAEFGKSYAKVSGIRKGRNFRLRLRLCRRQSPVRLMCPSPAATELHTRRPPACRPRPTGGAFVHRFHSTIAAVTVEAAGPARCSAPSDFPRRLKNRRQRVARLTLFSRHARGARSTCSQSMNSVPRSPSSRGPAVRSGAVAAGFAASAGGRCPLDRAGGAGCRPSGHACLMQGAADQRAQRRVACTPCGTYSLVSPGRGCAARAEA